MPINRDSARRSVASLSPVSERKIGAPPSGFTMGKRVLMTRSIALTRSESAMFQAGTSRMPDRRTAGSTPEHLLYRRNQFIQRKGLRKDRIVFEALHVVGFPSAHEEDLSRRIAGANAACQLDAAHFRHIDVRKYHIEALTVRGIDHESFHPIGRR